MSFSEYIEQNGDQLLLESGFSRMLQIMGGLVPSVKTFAIITWENPKGKESPAEYNKQKNKELQELLGRGSYGYIKIKGKYGNYENPFFIMNITRSAAIDLGKEGDQDSVIFGAVNAPEDITFELAYMDGRPSEVRHVWTKLDKGTKDYYSEYKGRKFVIPFFDSAFSDVKFKQGKITKEEFEIGANIFYEKDFDKSIVDMSNKDMEFYDVLSEEHNGKHRWLGRGYIHSRLAENKKHKL